MDSKIIYKNEDKTGVYDELFDFCLMTFEKANSKIGSKHNLHQSQVLSAIISLLVGFYNSAYGPEETFDLLDRIKAATAESVAKRAH